MKTLKSFLTEQHKRLMVLNETTEPDLSDLPWTIYVETDAADPLFQKFQRDHIKFIKDWMSKNL